MQRLLRSPTDPAAMVAADRYLQRLNAFMAGMSIYVLNDRGVVLATSSPRLSPNSLEGVDLSFRPYFLEALSGRVGRHFAIGTQSNVPGYFVSHPIHDGSRVVGVAAIKISLEPVNQIWEMLGAPALLADTNQVVILSSNPEWRYTTLANLPVERRVDLQLNRMYNHVRTPRFPLDVTLTIDEENQSVEGVLSRGQGWSGLSTHDTLVSGKTLNGMDWRVMMFSDLSPVRAQALTISAMSAVVIGFLILALLYMAQRRRIFRDRLRSEQMLARINAELEQKVEDRTLALTEANSQLRREVSEREQAESTLRATQDELVHAAKMAVLGRLAAGMTHELTQPLGGIRALAGNAIEFMSRKDYVAARDNLGIVASLAEKMGAIIHPLRTFARKTTPRLGEVDVAHAVSNALFLYQTQLTQSGIEVVNRIGPGDVMAWCDINRLEQVLINLIGNAIDAMATAPDKILTLEAMRGVDAPEDAALCAAGWARIDVLDTGCGLADDFATHLFEPFYTTKPRGMGLGLIISRDIVRDFGGSIRASRRNGPGACFSIHLPLAGLSEDPTPRT